MTDGSLAQLTSTLETAFAGHPDIFRPLLDPHAAAGVPWKDDISRIKRFLEWFSADKEFRDTVEGDPSIAERAGVDVDVEELRFLWDDTFHKEMTGSPGWVAPRSVQQYQMWICEKAQWRERLRLELCVPQEPRHKAWRERQINRTLTQLGANAYLNIIHAPFAIELSEGCSVGCWFCGVSAERKKTDFLYTEENRALWIDVLGVLRRRLGAAAGHGFLYWATDPLDNPDYEKFGLDFARICGKFPQTTTAQAQRHVERVRALLKLSTEHGCEINRFSLLSLSAFKKIQEAFTAEELLHCELVLQNREASTFQSNSGRARGARELGKRAEAKALDPKWRENPGTISCISGFLINMVRRTVQLITPCPSSDTWPKGHWILEEGSFRDAEEFAALVEGMSERHMAVAMRARDVVRLRPDLKLTASADGVRLESFGAIATFTGSPHMVALLQSVVAGNLTAGEIAIDMEDRLGWPASHAMSVLNSLFHQGLLDEEPHRAEVLAHLMPSGSYEEMTP